MQAGNINVDTTQLHGTGDRIVGHAGNLEAMLMQVLRDVMATEGFWQSAASCEFIGVHQRWNHHAGQLQQILGDIGCAGKTAAVNYADTDNAIASALRV